MRLQLKSKQKAAKVELCVVIPFIIFSVEDLFCLY